MILHDKTKKILGYAFDSCKVYDNFYCVCDYCGVEFLRSKRNILVGSKIIKKESCNNKQCARLKREEASVVKHGVKNAGGTLESLNKIKATNNERYGVDNTSKLSVVKEKMKKTSRERYGKDSYLATEQCREKLKKHFEENKDEILDKIKKTSQEKYGVDFYSQLDDAKNRKKQTSLDHCGVDHPMKTEEVQNHLKAVMLERHGVEYPLQKEEFVKKAKKTCQERFGEDNWLNTDFGKAKVRQTCRERYGVDSPLQNDEIFNKVLNTKKEKYGSAYPVNVFGKTQNDIKTWVNSLGFDFNSNTSVLNRKELDLYDQDLKIAIEYCGLFWHTEQSPEPRGRLYHYNKYKTCLDRGVRLITIFEDEWVHKENICKSIIQSILGKSEKIYARKCLIKEIPRKEYIKFCNENHLLGCARKSVISYGLFYNDKLVGAMSLGQHHRNSEKGIIVLDRLCFLNGVQVIGGATKLFKYCKKWAIENNFNKIITWSDNRWSSGRVYGKMGFVLDKELPPDYSYVNLRVGKIRKSKQSQKKKKDQKQTEKERCAENHLARIWDCGKKRWAYSV